MCVLLLKAKLRFRCNIELQSIILYFICVCVFLYVKGRYSIFSNPNRMQMFHRCFNPFLILFSIKFLKELVVSCIFRKMFHIDLVLNFVINFFMINSNFQKKNIFLVCKNKFGHLLVLNKWKKIQMTAWPRQSEFIDATMRTECIASAKQNMNASKFSVCTKMWQRSSILTICMISSLRCDIQNKYAQNWLAIIVYCAKCTFFFILSAPFVLAL